MLRRCEGFGIGLEVCKVISWGYSALCYGCWELEFHIDGEAFGRGKQRYLHGLARYREHIAAYISC